MPEEKQTQQEKEKQEHKEKREQREEQKEKQEQKQRPQPKQEEIIIRILATDIPAHMKLYPGLTRIKGVSWSFSNALCQVLKMDKNKKVSELSESDIQKIAEFIKNPKVPEWLLNRRKDMETGTNKHLATSDLDLQRDLDIRTMKKMRCYKGVRHSQGQPVRGQRTRGHFRKGKAVGVHRSKVTTKK